MARFELYITTTSGNIESIIVRNKPDDWNPLGDALRLDVLTYPMKEGWNISYATKNIETIKWRKLSDEGTR